jgi:tetratricopeptide (TPR) repeat protein
MSMFDDPLRSVRRAISDGQFKVAQGEIDQLPIEVRRTPECQLLSAMASWRLGDFPRSHTLALEARDGFRARGDVDGEMRAENVAAAGAFAVGELPAADRGFTRALELADELSDELMIARCANNLGNVAYYRAHHEAALSFYRLASANFQSLAFWKGLAETWLNSAIVLYEAGDLEGSQEAGERAVDAAEKSGDQRVLGQALAARSETDAALGDVALARALAERARVLASEHDHVVGEADALRVLSVIARLTGDSQRGAALGRRALVIAERVNDPWRRAEVQRDLGDLYASVGRTTDAAAAYAEAAQAFGELGADLRAARMRERLAAL